MRVPHTFTIDDMPESERPRRTIFKQDAPATAPAPAPEAPADSISLEDWAAFQQILFDALLPFPAARAAIKAAFDNFRQSFRGDPEYAPA